MPLRRPGARPRARQVHLRHLRHQARGRAVRPRRRRPRRRMGARRVPPRQGRGRRADPRQWAEIHFSALTEAQPAPPSGATATSTPRPGRRTSGTCGSPRSSRVDVAQALNAVTGSDKTVLNKWAVLTHMLKMAAQDGKIPRSPTIGVGPAGAPSTRPRSTATSPTPSSGPSSTRPPPTGSRSSSPSAAPASAGASSPRSPSATSTPRTALLRITKAEKQDPDNPARPSSGHPRRRRAAARSPPPRRARGPRAAREGRKRNDRLFLPPNGGPLRHRTFYRDIWLKKSVGRPASASPTRGSTTSATATSPGSSRPAPRCP
jgi:hypothetical protein